MRRTKEVTKTSTTSGESYYMRSGFSEALKKGALDIITSDLQKTGGLLEVHKIAHSSSTA